MGTVGSTNAVCGGIQRYRSLTTSARIRLIIVLSVGIITDSSVVNKAEVKEMNYEKVKERIAQTLFERTATDTNEQNDGFICNSWEDLLNMQTSISKIVRAYYYEYASTILADPDILVKAEDQEMPDNVNDGHGSTYQLKDKEGVMIVVRAAGFVKVEPKPEVSK